MIRKSGTGHLDTDGGVTVDIRDTFRAESSATGGKAGSFCCSRELQAGEAVRTVVAADIALIQAIISIAGTHAELALAFIGRGTGFSTGLESRFFYTNPCIGTGQRSATPSGRTGRWVICVA